MALIICLCAAFFLCNNNCYAQERVHKNKLSIDTLSNFKCKLSVEYKDKNVSKELASTLMDVAVFGENMKVIPNMYVLKSRLKNIIEEIRKVASDYGYFGISVKYKISHVRNRDVAIKIYVDTGARYKISNIDLLTECKLNVSGDYIQNREVLVGNYYDTKRLINVCNKIESEFRNIGYPYAKVTGSDVYANREQKNVRVVINVKRGDKFYIGETRILAPSNVNRNFIKNRIFWNKNGVYKENNIQMTSHMLMVSQMFSDIDILLDKENAIEIDGGNGYIAPIDLKLKEEKPRAIEFNLTYSTSKRNGFYKHYKGKGKLKSLTGKFKWSHYNVFSTSSKLSFGMSGTPHNVFKKNEANDYEMFAELDVPDTFIPCDNIIYSAKNIQVYKNAYYKKSQVFSVVWTSPPTIQDFKLQAGVFVDDNNTTSPLTREDKPIEVIDKYNSICMPISFSIDKRDSTLNPTKNGEFSTTIIPMIFSSGLTNNATLCKMSGSINFDISKRKKTVISLKCVGAQMLGKKLDKIPVDKKLYAGGISSVRGYADQMASNLHDKTRYPIGGGALLEFSGEIRQNIKNDTSVVLFLDTAKVSKNSVLAKDNWHTGVGIGLRYNTIVGPIRFDIATPLKKRSAVDRRYQIYISLGQAF